MEQFESNIFVYKNNELYCEDVPVSKIAEETGTPVYIYSRRYFEESYKEFTEAFAEVPHTIFFAAKANFNLSVLKLFSSMGSGIDVNSEGELYRALHVGADPKKLILTGVGKTPDEIKLGIEHGVLMIKAESEDEILTINETAAALNKTAPVAIRVNPDVNAQTHPYISTGLAENKFGINMDEAYSLYKRESEFKHIKFTGIDMHIGSQITRIEPFVEAVTKLADLYLKLKSEGLILQHFDLGGGIGVRYRNENTFRIKELADAVMPVLKKLGCTIFFEPGRYLTANGGILAGRVVYTKKNGKKNFMVTDTAMTELLRPSIYNAYHHIQPVRLTEGRQEIVSDVVGPVCESGDFLAKDRQILEIKKDELIAVYSAGAYGMVMSSNYNARRRAPEVLVSGGTYKIIRSRETFDHLLFDENIKL